MGSQQYDDSEPRNCGEVSRTAPPKSKRSHGIGKRLIRACLRQLGEATEGRRPPMDASSSWRFHGEDVGPHASFLTTSVSRCESIAGSIPSSSTHCIKAAAAAAAAADWAPLVPLDSSCGPGAGSSAPQLGMRAGGPFSVTGGRGPALNGAPTGLAAAGRPIERLNSSGYRAGSRSPCGTASGHAPPPRLALVLARCTLERGPVEKRAQAGRRESEGETRLLHVPPPQVL